MPSTKISAIICTHNRDTYLGAAIDSLLAQDFADGFEVVVVDNGSIDQTRSVVEQRTQNPLLKYVFEPTIGLSVARNTGAKVACGEILAYLDDDAVASSHWLQALYSAYQNNSNLAIAGGKVTLLWPDNIEPPRWLSKGLAVNLGAYDLGESIIFIENPGLTPRGLNYSLRRSFLTEIGGFDTHLGRIGKKLLSNEELQMTELALQKGWQVAYLPNALVAHNVSPERLKRSWFINRGWWQGISECYREQLAGKAGIGQLQLGSERFLRGLYKALQYFSDPAERFDKLVYAYGQIGYLNAAIQGLLSKKGRGSS
ncbi:glycosyltransferase family 2 protein [Aetokthonos hydrillicola Thurmond2011]|jgi:glycosyltransferase involved in cell wall biosynthesis|uniref:Glycosyltransferase family 2 protein n=1 Tax=Aetokthonos hydrillicola Thurmond2011 TaxID=2712845 RepID=A0AAP5I414_9CYAN|nr:glycosyltransferase family 2 protein [Aetokthonos hydrillicola]MBO3462692.1 glycosyltransferase family 2 protein [Aetokthonos hydrillicola CCALA 1050]MBW4588064.1 glycosyltransferase family 2 protein [Aetokthonos hydrillicola CCALA 1050]MDR9893379.1 glycosyltransferase family 2 protein [Aetokthonos hydrillicola Thurmond2011]